MKTLILSDIHNQESKKAIKTLDGLIERENAEKLVFLGDCDIPLIYKYLLALNLDKRIVIGNHEHAWAHNIAVYSSFLEFRQGEYMEWWNEHPDLKEFILEKSKLIGELSGKIVIDDLDGKQVAYSHCGIAWNKSLDSDFCTKLELRGIIQDSFKEMQKQDYWLWFKGHDHASQILSLPIDANPYKQDHQEKSSPVTFNSKNRYITRVGCFALGLYAVLDEKNMKLEFKNLFR